MANSIAGTAGMNYSQINNTISQGVRSQENAIIDQATSLASSSDGNISPTDLLAMQQKMANWTLMVDLQSTMTKSLSDSLKSVVQKSG